MGCCCSTDDSESGQQTAPYGSGSRGGQKAFAGAGHALGGGGVDSSSGVDPRDAAAAAAFEREQALTTTDRDRKLAERRQKDELIGKIQAYYSQLRKDPPIGLAASTIDQLRKHLDHVKHEAGRQGRSVAI